jgi:SAM-dependent methyltransferase
MPEFSSTDLEAYVRQRAPQIAQSIRIAARRAKVEADIVGEVEKILERFAKSFDVTLHLERERTLVNGRADAVYNRMVIEYEPPSSLRPSNRHKANKHAIEQVMHYMEGLERLDRHKKEKLAGAVLDGTYFIFIRHRDDRWRIDEPLPVEAHSTETFLRYLLSLSTELALTPANLVRDFGENSDTARRVVPRLYEALKDTDHPKVVTLFRQWQRQFREVSGYDPKGTQLDPRQLGRLFAVRDGTPDLEKLFFCIHTYYATFIKLLALQIAQYYLMPKVGTGLAAIADYESERLRGYLEEMERGGLLAQLGIRNFLEGDFFGWYLAIWNEPLEAAARRLIGSLANYSLVTLDVDPEETRDLLKKLYQNLMPKKLRHALGEYYTPDWLAERVLNQLGYVGDPRKRLLDPACGSGTFLVLAIKRIRASSEKKMLPRADVLENVLANIVGYDLNPLAVISARTNYLLALGDLLSHRKGDVHIPVYLADSIVTPSMEVSAGGQLSFIPREAGGKVRHPGYRFVTAVGVFSIPRSLVDARYIDLLADLLEDSVRMRLTAAQFRSKLLEEFPMDEARDEGEITLALNLFEGMQDLENQGINGIWARVVKNAFAPLFQGRFDYVAGNPPWVNWESLPEDYRQETKPLWEYHGLFPHGGMDTILGKGKKDISMLMTYVAMEDYLQKRGRLGFLITQSVFKTAGAGQGFRRFVLGSGAGIAPAVVDDLSDLKPFEGASNRTAVVVLNKGRTAKYPVSYNQWYKPSGGSSIPEDLSLDDLRKDRVATYREYEARPVDQTDPTSPWITGRSGMIRAIERVLGHSQYEGMAGVSTWLNGVYWVEIVERRPDGQLVVANRTEGTKVKVESVQAVLESGLVFPLLRAGDIGKWSAVPEASILLVQDPQKRRGYDLEWMKSKYPRTYGYLKRFEDVLRARSGYKRYFTENDPFYSMFNVGEYTLSPFKVVWPNIGTHITAAVVGSQNGKPVIPQHIVTLVPLTSAAEAHFVCAVVNSSPFNVAVQSHTEKGGKSFATPGILEKVRIPKYSAKDSTCKRLARLSLQAHEAVAKGGETRVAEIEEEIDELSAILWGLTKQDLKEIRRGMEALD